MRPVNIADYLTFYFITDDGAKAFPLYDQVQTAISCGATMVQYRKKDFDAADWEALDAICRLCATNRVPLIVNDSILLARAVNADGVHLGQTDEDLARARRILGDGAIVGTSVSTPAELAQTDLSACDYIGTGPVFATGTKADAKAVIGPDGLQAVAEKAPVPVVAIGGITPDNARRCMESGAAGVAVISSITRSDFPADSAAALAAACGVGPRELAVAWRDEFGLIRQVFDRCAAVLQTNSWVEVAAGDDAALFKGLSRPVFTTDTQRDGIHFCTRWQSMAEIGKKAVEITFSDLAAAYAQPAGLFINLALPQTVAEKDVVDLYDGVKEALFSHGAALGGGNVSAGSSVAIDLFAAGEGGPVFPRRNAARAGDGVYVTGLLGLARAGLHCLIKGDNAFASLVAKFKCPRARFDAAEILAGHGVVCVTDISDGLAGDAGHIAEASGVTIEFLPDLFQVSPELHSFCRAYGLAPVHEILAGGEDYELLFTCSPERFAAISPHLPDAHCVGRCVAYAGRALANLPEGVGSYRHGEGRD
ncbi:MAG: thiamine-phosphate kinase [Thermodesulfobacteriota bacterium]